MENLMEKDTLRLDGSVAVKEATNEVRAISDNSKKISAYYNVLAAEAFKQYLDDNDIVSGETINLRSSSKFLSEFEVSDIQLPNLSIYVRVVNDEELLFVPKKHFDNKITPDVYLFVKVDEELKTGEILGYVRPDGINQKNCNGKFYFVNRSFLKPLSELISLIKNSAVKEQYMVSDKTEETLEKFILLYLDNDIDDTKLEKLIDYLKNSSVAREKLIEYENFERLSYMSLQEFKDLNIENNDFSKYIRTLFPADEFSGFVKKEEMVEEENPVNNGGLFIDDDLIKTEEKNEENSNQILEDIQVGDEFDVFEEASDFPALKEEDLVFNEENIPEVESSPSDEINDEEDVSVAGEVLSETFEEGETLPEIKDFDDYTNETDEDADIEIVDDENVFVPDDLDVNILDDVNETGNGLDTETVIGLTEDVLYDGNTEEEQAKIDVEEAPSEINGLDELHLVTDEEIDMAISESGSELINDIEPVITDENIDFDAVEFDEEVSAVPEIKEEDETEFHSEELVIDEENPDLSEMAEKTETEFQPYESEISEEDEQAPLLMQDEEEEDLISYSEDNTELDDAEEQAEEEGPITEEEPTLGDITAEEQEDNNYLNDIFSDGVIPEPPQEAADTAQETPVEDTEYQGTDFAFATDKGMPASQKITAAVAASIVILGIGGFGAWYFLNHGKSTPVANVNTGNSERTDLKDLSLDNINTNDTTPVANENNSEIIKEEKIDKDVVANLNIPAKASDVKNNKPSEQLTIQKIKKDFSKPDTYLSVSRIVWDVPEYLTYNDDFNSYLQTVGSSLKVNLSSDLLLINENPILNNVKLKVGIKNSGKTFTVDVTQGCGVQNIDNLVLQSVKKTMNILKPPVNSLDTADEDLYLTICL